MIKKYNEFIKEVNLLGINSEYSFPINKDELDDQFLRLEEIYNCFCSTVYPEENNMDVYVYAILYYLSSSGPEEMRKEAKDIVYNWTEDDFKKYKLNVDDEIDTVVKRLINMYPDISFKLEKGYAYNGVYRIICTTKHYFKTLLS